MFKIYKKMYKKAIVILAKTNPLDTLLSTEANVVIWHKKLFAEVLNELKLK